jgi:hypothetical protein
MKVKNQPCNIKYKPYANRPRAAVPVTRRNVLVSLELSDFEKLKAVADASDPPRPLGFTAREAIKRGLRSMKGAAKKSKGK